MSSKTRSIIITLCALVFLTGTGMVAASPATTKASPLYPIKKAIEAASLAFAAPADKAVVQATQLEERITELNTLKLQIANLEKAQQLDQAARLQEAAAATKVAAQQIAAQTKVDAQLMTNENKKVEVLHKVDISSQELDNEAPESPETPEATETPEPKEVPEAK